MLSEDILFLPVAELSKRVRARQLSPVELAESYLDRSRTIGKKLNAYATLTPDLALKQAHTAEKEIAAGKYRGPLHGIPYAAKDLLAVKGYPPAGAHGLTLISALTMTPRSSRSWKLPARCCWARQP